VKTYPFSQEEGGASNLDPGLYSILRNRQAFGLEQWRYEKKKMWASSFIYFFSFGWQNIPWGRLILSFSGCHDWNRSHFLFFFLLKRIAFG
jgi:hypothetical protein